MIKKNLLTIILVLFSIFLNGCWSYRGLNEISIVSGIAIDINPGEDIYRITFEVFDIASSSKENGIESLYFEAEGKTVFDAVRNAKREIKNKLYFSNTLIILVCEEIAKQGYIPKIIDWTLRDGELRETTNIAISKEKSAGEILKVKSLNTKIISDEIDDILTKDNRISASTVDKAVYEIYNDLTDEGKSLVLPAVKKTQNNDDITVEVCGTAVLREDKLAGYLTPEESKYLLFVLDKINGGLFTFSNKDENKHDITLEILENKTKIKYEYSDGNVKFIIMPETKVYIAEVHEASDLTNDKVLNKIKKNAEDELTRKIVSVINKVQNEYNTDIFGFGNHIYKKDPKLWKLLKNDWDKLFCAAGIEVEPKIILSGSAFRK